MNSALIKASRVLGMIKRTMLVETLIFEKTIQVYDKISPRERCSISEPKINVLYRKIRKSTVKSYQNTNRAK